MSKASVVAAICLFLPVACGPVGSPSSNPDHGPAKPPNGIIDNPKRPAGIQAGWRHVNWHVTVYDQNDFRHERRVTVRITAQSQVPGKSVHGGYPFSIYTFTPYTHTIWYEPGLVVSSSIVASIDPPADRGWYVECTATSAGLDLPEMVIGDDPQTCVSSVTAE